MLYARAENLFSERGDTRNELHAKVGRLRSEAETMSFVHLSRFLNEHLQNPIRARSSNLVRTIKSHSSVRNLIKAGLSRHRLLPRRGLNLSSGVRKRSGVRDRYRSVEPRPTCPM